jgi:hypothetical protein
MKLVIGLMLLVVVPLVTKAVLPNSGQQWLEIEKQQQQRIHHFGEKLRESSLFSQFDFPLPVLPGIKGEHLFLC